MIHLLTNGCYFGVQHFLKEYSSAPFLQSRHVQHMLTTLNGERIQVLPKTDLVRSDHVTPVVHLPAAWDYLTALENQGSALKGLRPQQGVDVVA